MSDFSFIVQIFASMTALCGSYLMIIYLLNEPVRGVRLRGVAALSLLASGISIGAFQAVFQNDPNLYMIISAVFLLLGLFNGLAIVTAHRFYLKIIDGYPAEFIPMIRLLSIFMFISLTIHFLFELAAFAWK